jgi:hypothetical protein
LTARLDVDGTFERRWQDLEISMQRKLADLVVLTDMS